MQIHSYGRRNGKLSATVLWLLEDPENRVVRCLDERQRKSFLDYLFEYSDERLITRTREFWITRVQVG